MHLLKHMNTNSITIKLLRLAHSPTVASPVANVHPGSHSEGLKHLRHALAIQVMAIQVDLTIQLHLFVFPKVCMPRRGIASGPDVSRYATERKRQNSTSIVNS